MALLRGSGLRPAAPQPRSPAFINWSTHDVAWGLLTYQLSRSFPYHTRQATATSKLILRCQVRRPRCSQASGLSQGAK
eukprot:scaffold3392_cov131-Isochrysis_galbana.AAC.5